MLKKLDAMAFIDWQAQIINSAQNVEIRSDRKAESTINFVTSKISDYFSEVDDYDIINVEMRLYHGWYMGLTPSENMRSLISLFNDGLTPFSAGKVKFDWRDPFGHNMNSAFDHRRHRKINVHLPDTLREDFENGGRSREKMVDTALICDLLCNARSFPSDWKIVMGEDDDLIPGVFVSEFWSKNAGGKTIVMRRREPSAHLRLENLLYQIG